MPRIALGLEYDGTDFVGWQIQRAGRSVEAALAAAVQAVANEPMTVHGAGRTDAGVHAAQQVAHFDTSAGRSERQWLLGINSNLPPDVAGSDDPTGTEEVSPLDPQTMTEVGTKLDLARAYIDMGDPEGARSILEEVLDEGDPGQRREAQGLIDVLSA